MAIRAFVALRLAESVQAATAKQMGRWKTDWPQVKWVRPEQLHFTLAFLGAVAAERIPEAIQACQQSAMGCPRFSLTLGNLGFFPPQARARVFWLGVTQGEKELIQLQSQLAGLLSQKGFALEDRAFVPHLTLARIDPPQNPPPIVNQWKASALAPSTMQVSAIHLMQSELKPSGAVYTPLAECLLV